MKNDMKKCWFSVNKTDYMNLPLLPNCIVWWQKTYIKIEIHRHLIVTLTHMDTFMEPSHKFKLLLCHNSWHTYIKNSNIPLWQKFGHDVFLLANMSGACTTETCIFRCTCAMNIRSVRNFTDTICIWTIIYVRSQWAGTIIGLHYKLVTFWTICSNMLNI